MSKTQTIFETHALVSKALEDRTPNAFEVLKEAAGRAQGLAIDLRKNGVSVDFLDSAREIATNLQVLTAALQTHTVEGVAKECTDEAFYAYVTTEVEGALASDRVACVDRLAKLKALLEKAAVDSGESICLAVETGEVTGSREALTKALDPVIEANFIWPMDLNKF